MTSIFNKLYIVGQGLGTFPFRWKRSLRFNFLNMVFDVSEVQLISRGFLQHDIITKNQKASAE